MPRIILTPRSASTAATLVHLLVAFHGAGTGDNFEGIVTQLQSIAEFDDRTLIGLLALHQNRLPRIVFFQTERGAEDLAKQLA